ncbi:MAG: chromate transporter, partial [Verrucomicrobia bacterium]|nr:chromate transporter [Verrucomicrobiota bacterium]
MSFAEFARLGWRIGWGSFGGPAAQIELLHRIFVKEKALLSEEVFQKALGICTLLPGPEAQQLSATLGLKLHGVRGALAGGFLFVLPGALMMGGWSVLYVMAPGHPVTGVVLQILRPAALGLILSSVARLAIRTLKTPGAWGIAAGSG